MSARTTASVLVIILGLFSVVGVYAQASDDHSVVILSPTVSGGINSPEAVAATSLGFTVDVKTPTEWSGMSASDFASYRAIIMGDPTCEYSTSAISAAVANNSVWGPEIDGNVIIIGSDPVWHINYSWSLTGPSALVNKAMAFVLSIPNTAGKTSAYICLSCYYDGTSAAVPLLDYVFDGGFSVGPIGCYNDAHILAYHPALDGLTDADLSDWLCSIHEVFTAYDTDNFDALAVGVNDDGSYIDPYIIAHGVCTSLPTIEVSLSPNYLWPPNNQMNDITATVVTTGDNVAVELVSITSDEGDELNDVAAVFGTDDRDFQVRAQRDGNGDGRVYTVTYKVTDECGHEATAVATIEIPHDQR